MDADGSHDPKEIRNLYETAVKGYDIVIGSRYIDGGHTYNGFMLRMMSYTVNFIYRVLFNIDAKDVSNSFKIYKAEKLKSIELTCSNFDIVEEILIIFRNTYKSSKMIEIPVFFNKRMFGRSKRNLLKFAITYVFTIAKLLKIKSNRNIKSGK